MDLWPDGLLLAVTRDGGPVRRAAVGGRRLAGLVLVAGLIGGCGGAPKPSGEFAASGDLRQRADAIAQKVQSISAGGLDTEALHTRLTNDCIREQGVEVANVAPPPVNPGVLPEITDLDLWLNRGQPLGLATALSDPAKLEEHRSFIKRNQDFENPPMSPEALKVSEGDPPKLVTIPLPGDNGGSVSIPVGGCFGAATEKLYGTKAETFERTRLELPRLDTIMDKSTSDGRVDAAADGYAACMRQQGFKARTPSDLQDVIGPTLGGVLDGKEQPSRLAELERRAVASDMRCKTSSGLGTAFAKAFVENGEKALKGSEGVVIEYGRMMDHARSVARQLETGRQ